MDEQSACRADVILHFGSAIKALGDGKVGGYLVNFGSDATKDADGEWFTPETDFDTEFPSRASIYYNHGLDPVVGRRRLAHGTMKSDDLGVWVEAQLELSDRYQAAMYRMAAAGKLGWSSGSLSHITDPPREAPGGAIKSWPLGHDASLTPIPSDRRNLAIALKSWEPPPLEELVTDLLGPHRTASLVEDTERWVEMGEVLIGNYRTHAAKAGRKLSAPRRERLARIRQLIDEMLTETAPREEAEGEASAHGVTAPATGSGEEEARPLLVASTLPDLQDLYAARLSRAEGGLSLGRM